MLEPSFVKALGDDHVELISSLIRFRAMSTLTWNDSVSVPSFRRSTQDETRPSPLQSSSPPVSTRRESTSTVPRVVATPTATLARATALFVQRLKIQPTRVLRVVVLKVHPSRCIIPRHARRLHLRGLPTEPGSNIIEVAQQETLLVRREGAGVEISAHILHEIHEARVFGVAGEGASSHFHIRAALGVHGVDFDGTDVRECRSDFQLHAPEFQRVLRVDLVEAFAVLRVHDDLAGVLGTFVDVEMLRCCVVVGPDLHGEGCVVEVGFDDLVAEFGPDVALIGLVDVGERLHLLAEVLFEELCALDGFEMCEVDFWFWVW